ncbi:MAG TPA: hypothetical protein VH761_15885 [Ilumatobacteraceae bacterium]
MNSIDMESRVRDVLASQAAALQPPDVRPDDAVVIVGPASSLHRRPPRRRVVLAAAAVGLLAAAGIAIAVRSGDDTIEPGSPVDGGVHFATPTVSLDAASVSVEANGRTFVPPADTTVGGDPGTWNEYTQLELEWSDDGIPMRINMYFASDGTDWWATELRTYDGNVDGEWIEMPGEFFRSALGTTWHGDLDVQSLHIRGLALQAFVRPAACGSTTQPVALVSNQNAINSIAGGGYGALVTLFDTAACTPVAIDRFNVAITSDDGNVATVQPLQLPEDFEMPTGAIRVDLQTPNPGTTTVHVTITDQATRALVDSVDIPVTVRSGDGPNVDTLPAPQPVDTAAP